MLCIDNAVQNVLDISLHRVYTRFGEKSVKVLIEATSIFFAHHVHLLIVRGAAFDLDRCVILSDIVISTDTSPIAMYSMPHSYVVDFGKVCSQLRHGTFKTIRESLSVSLEGLPATDRTIRYCLPTVINDKVGNLDSVVR
jgi:hypothetical protein